MYWNTIPVGSVTLRTPNTHVTPNNGKSTTQARNTRLKKGVSMSSNSHFLNIKTKRRFSRAREKRECMWELMSFPRGEAAVKLGRSIVTLLYNCSCHSNTGDMMSKVWSHFQWDILLSLLFTVISFQNSSFIILRAFLVWRLGAFGCTPSTGCNLL